MSNRRQDESSASNGASASTVQIAFDANPTPHHCGYCNTDGSCSAGIVATNMLVDDYQALMDRGWRKCGTYYYKALMDKTCCPLYTIRCDTTSFKISASQRRVIQQMNRFINENRKPGEKNPASLTPTTTSVVTLPPMALEEWIKTEPSTNATQLLQHILNSDAPLPDEFAGRLRSRQKRWHRKLLKLKERNQLTPQTDIRSLIKRFDRVSTHSTQTLEQMLQFSDKSTNKFETRLIRSYPPSEEFTRTLEDSHAVYKRYQMAIHGDAPSACSLSQFKRFLGQSSLQEKSPRLASNAVPSCGYGSFHLQYYLNDRIIACGVLDILPGGVSSVYFYYEPHLGSLKLGVYSALREVELTRRLAGEIPDMKHYYLGFYVHSCVKMRYKTYTWHPIEKCRPLLNAHKYARFESDPTKVDEHDESSIEQLKLRVHGRIITPVQLQEINEEYFSFILDCFFMFAKFAGRPCASRIIIDLN